MTECLYRGQNARGEVSVLRAQAEARIARGGFTDYGHFLAWVAWANDLRETIREGR